MNFFVRFFVGYVIVALVAVLLATHQFTGQLVPGVRQSVEETLLQTANLLAELAARDLAEHPSDKHFAGVERLFGAYAKRRFDARISGILRNDPDLRIYVTNQSGRVVFDSRGRDVGADYSRWLDVARTLKGQYGARTTRDVADDSTSSVMYVAAPILQDGRVVGVLSVGKPSRSFQGFIDIAKQNAWRSAFGLFVLAMLVALAFSYWMTRDLRRLVEHANEVAEGRRDSIPIEGRSELRRLAQALEHLRAELDGKAHVEKVTQLLAHELKSPIAAIRGAAELLPDETDPARRALLEANIGAEAERLGRIVEGVLNLARTENRGKLDEAEEVIFDALVAEVVASRSARLAGKGIEVDADLVPARVTGSRFLLRQALSNLLDNAIDFSPRGGRVIVSLIAEADRVALRIRDQGPGIPAWALPRLFDRFYSTPRPDTGERSSGLGLNLVQEVARLHHGVVHVGNHADGGAEARLELPVRRAG